MLYAVKILVTSLLVLLISELSKKNQFFGGIIASLPTISVLSILWIYAETKDSAKIASFSYHVFVFVFPSLLFFLSLPFFLKRNFSFPLAFFLAVLLCSLVYLAAIYVFKKADIHF